jgi:hypothetical protein
MDKGTRVEIVRGRAGKGVVGTVFWVGEDRFNEGSSRLGVRGDDGETYWVSGDNVEPTDAEPPDDEGPELEKGDRVSWRRGEDEGEGEVFWLGPSKHGGGVRVGVRDEAGETWWFDARQLTPVGGQAAAAIDDEEPPF